MNNAWYLINVPNMNKITTFSSEIAHQTLKIYEKCQNYSNLALSFTCISSPWYLIMVPNMNNIQPANMQEYARMDSQMARRTVRWKDRWLDRLMDQTLSIFANSAWNNNVLQNQSSASADLTFCSRFLDPCDNI